MNSHVAEYLPAAAGVYDPLADEAATGSNEELAAPSPGLGAAKAKLPREPMLRFYSLEQLAAYQEPPNQKMAGDYHLQRGAISVLGGPPGCGRSRASLTLALAGAVGVGNWLGLKIHCRFRTIILQNENGLARLHRDVPRGADLTHLRDWVRISAPPVVGLAIHNPLFRAELKAVVRGFQPDLLIVDPFNATTRDSMEKDFSETLTRLREVLAEADGNPACLILHHVRKPKSDDKQRGRGLTNLLAGSYVLVSVARAVLVMQPATDDTEDDRVIVTPAKNNDGELGPRTAWHRANGGFELIPEFDWAAHDGGQAAPQVKVSKEHLLTLFEEGRRRLPLAAAATRLMVIAKVGRSAAYTALKLDGRFADQLGKSVDDGCMFYKKNQSEFSDNPKP